VRIQDLRVSFEHGLNEVLTKQNKSLSLLHAATSVVSRLSYKEAIAIRIGGPPNATDPMGPPAIPDVIPSTYPASRIPVRMTGDTTTFGRHGVLESAECVVSHHALRALWYSKPVPLVVCGKSLPVCLVYRSFIPSPKPSCPSAVPPRFRDIPLFPGSHMRSLCGLWGGESRSQKPPVSCPPGRRTNKINVLGSHFRLPDFMRTPLFSVLCSLELTRVRWT